MTAGSSSTSSSDPGCFLSLACPCVHGLDPEGISGLLLRSSQAQKVREGGGNAKQRHRDLTRRCTSRIASQALSPREARVSPLARGEDHVRGGWRSSGGRRQADLDALVAHQLHAGAPVDSAAPIPPEQRCGTHSERMQQHTDLARLGRRGAVPLTPLAQRTGTTPADASSIHHAQAPVGFSAVFMGEQLLVSGTAQCPIGLESKVLTREAARFPG